MSDQSLKDLDHMVKFNPTPATHRMRGDARLLVHDFAGAMDDFQYIIDARPTDKYAQTKYREAKVGLEATTKVTAAAVAEPSSQPAAAPIDTNAPAAVLVKNGYDLLQRGENDQALQCLTAAVKKEPENPDARRYLAYALASTGQNEEAATQFAALATLKALSPADNLVLGKALAGCGRLREAAGVYSTVLSADETNSQARVELIKTYVKMGDQDQAARAAREGTQVSPSMQSTFEQLLKAPAKDAKPSAK
jgi:tetratricopeptide (TPR) repeat protein